MARLAALSSTNTILHRLLCIVFPCLYAVRAQVWSAGNPERCMYNADNAVAQALLRGSRIL
ncbi:MAG: hypothetical protein LBC14_05415, partial [Desulfovibrio sp.]|nr:hypothetical protein [Desulfovibrio sp.]